MHSTYILVLFSKRSNNTRRNPILDRSCEKTSIIPFLLATLYVLFILEFLDIYLTDEKKNVIKRE